MGNMISTRWGSKCSEKLGSKLNLINQLQIDQLSKNFFKETFTKNVYFAICFYLNVVYLNAVHYLNYCT